MSTKQTQSADSREIGYYNSSTKQVIPGYSPLFNSLSKGRADVDKNGNVAHIENIAGSPREILLNLKGQFQLDQHVRGGVRLWQRIYSQDELIQKMEALGISTGVKSEDKAVNEAF